MTLQEDIYNCLKKHNPCSDINGEGECETLHLFNEEMKEIFKKHKICNACNSTTISKAIRGMYSLFHVDDIDDESSHRRYNLIAELLVQLSTLGS